MTWVSDGSGTRWIDYPERKRRAPSVPRRFANLEVGAVLIHRAKWRSEEHVRHDPVVANDDHKLIEKISIGFALVEDRWFDPVAGQRDRWAGEMAGLRYLTSHGRAPSKTPHTLRGLAQQGYNYATAEHARLIVETVAERERITDAYTAGDLALDEARVRMPPWSKLLRDLGLGE